MAIFNVLIWVIEPRKPKNLIVPVVSQLGLSCSLAFFFFLFIWFTSMCVCVCVVCVHIKRPIRNQLSKLLTIRLVIGLRHVNRTWFKSTKRDAHYKARFECSESIHPSIHPSIALHSTAPIICPIYEATHVSRFMHFRFLTNIYSLPPETCECHRNAHNLKDFAFKLTPFTLHLTTMSRRTISI